MKLVTSLSISIVLLLTLHTTIVTTKQQSLLDFTYAQMYSEPMGPVYNGPLSGYSTSSLRDPGLAAGCANLTSGRNCSNNVTYGSPSPPPANECVPISDPGSSVGYGLDCSAPQDDCFPYPDPVGMGLDCSSVDPGEVLPEHTDMPYKEAPPEPTPPPPTPPIDNPPQEPRKIPPSTYEHCRTIALGAFGFNVALYKRCVEASEEDPTKCTVKECEGTDIQFPPGLGYSDEEEMCTPTGTTTCPLQVTCNLNPLHPKCKGTSYDPNGPFRPKYLVPEGQNTQDPEEQQRLMDAQNQWQMFNKLWENKVELKNQR